MVGVSHAAHVPLGCQRSWAPLCFLHSDPAMPLLFMLAEFAVLLAGVGKALRASLALLFCFPITERVPPCSWIPSDALPPSYLTSSPAQPRPGEPRIIMVASALSLCLDQQEEIRLVFRDPRILGREAGGACTPPSPSNCSPDP